MHTLLGLLILLCSSCAIAGCRDFATLSTKIWDIDISDQGCKYDELMITFSRVGGRSTGIAFTSECREFSHRSGARGFSCKATGKSPMAGATYKLVKRGKPYCPPDSSDGGSPGYQYACIKGCNRSTPKHLIQPTSCE